MLAQATEPVDRIERRIGLLEQDGILNHPKAEACIRAMYAREQAVVLGGGSGGGGKSHTLRAGARHFAFALHKTGLHNEKIFFGTLDYPALQDRHLDRFIADYGDYGKLQENRAFGLHWRWNDRRIPVICFRNLEDPNKRKGSEFAGGFIDETTELMRKIFGAVAYMCRKPGLPWNPILTMSNPDGLGFNWCKQTWRPEMYGHPEDGWTADKVLAWALAKASSMPAYSESFDPSGKMRPADYIYIPFRPQDNPTFDEERWWRGVAHLPVHIQRARWLGLWNVAEGARWGWLTEDRTIFSAKKEWRTGVPDNWYRIVSVDYGTRNPYCALFTVEDWDGNLWTYQEIYSAGLAAEAQISLIKERLGEHVRVDRFVGDPAMWQVTHDKRSGQKEPSIAEIYQEGIKSDKRFAGGFERGPTGDMINKLATLDRYLTYDNGHPDWFIEESCVALWNELTGAVYATGSETKERKETIDDSCPQHAIDAAVYGFHARLVRPKEHKPIEVQVAEVQEKSLVARANKLKQDALKEMRRTQRLGR